MYLYVVDSQDKLLGVIDIKELLLADDKALLKDIMVTGIIISIVRRIELNKAGREIENLTLFDNLILN